MDIEFGTPYHRKTIDQCRAIGRIGGLRATRNRRFRRRAQPPAPVEINPTLDPEDGPPGLPTLGCEVSVAEGCLVSARVPVTSVRDRPQHGPDVPRWTPSPEPTARPDAQFTT